MKTKAIMLTALFITTLIFVACSKESGPKDIVRELYSGLEKNDVAAIKTKSSKALLAVLNDEKLTKGVEKQSKEIAKKQGIKEIQFTDEKVQENQIDYKIVIMYNDGSDKKDKIRLVMEDGEWKVAPAK